MTIICVIQLGFLSNVRPYDIGYLNKLEIFNEAVVLICCVFLILFSDGLIVRKHPSWPTPNTYVGDFDLHFIIGWVNVGILSLLFLVNLAVMMTLKVKVLMHLIKVCHKKRELKE